MDESQGSTTGRVDGASGGSPARDTSGAIGASGGSGSGADQQNGGRSGGEHNGGEAGGGDWSGGDRLGDRRRGGSGRHADPWAHRRGEPRVFAFCWMIYLLLALSGSVLWVLRSSDLTSDSYSPAARIMLVVLAAGSCVLWPMTRLSQRGPEGNVLGHTFLDLVVVLVPAQVVVWPMSFLARWPLDVVAGVSLLLASWTALIGGVLAVAQTTLGDHRDESARGVARSVWMGVVLVLVGVGPVCIGVLEAMSRPVPGWLASMSPFTGIYSVSGRGLRGATHPVTDVEWTTMVGVLASAALVWGVAVLGRVVVGARERL